jgi:hypothetical protein
LAPRDEKSESVVRPVVEKLPHLKEAVPSDWEVLIRLGDGKEVPYFKATSPRGAFELWATVWKLENEPFSAPLWLTIKPWLGTA